MKKALTSVFKGGKSPNGSSSVQQQQQQKTNKLGDNTETQLTKQFSGVSRSVDHLNDLCVDPYSMKGCNSIGLEKSNFSKLSSAASSSMSSKKSHLQSASAGIDQRKTSLDQCFESASSSSRLQSAARDVCDSLAVVCTSPHESDNDDMSLASKGSKLEHHRKTAASKSKFLSDNFAAEKTAASNQELRRMQSNDSTIEERSSRAAMKSKMEANGFKATKMEALMRDQKQIHIGDTYHQHKSSAKASAINMRTDDSMSQKKSFESQNSQRMISQSGGMMSSHQEKNLTSHSSSRFVSNTSTAAASAAAIMSSSENNFHSHLKSIQNGGSSDPQPIITEPFSPTMMSLTNEVESEFDMLSLAVSSSSTSLHNKLNLNKVESLNMKGSMAKLERKMSNLVEKLKTTPDSLEVITVMTDMLRKAWSVPQCGYDLGFNMCKLLGTSGALDVLIKNCSEDIDDWDIQFLSAQLLEQCLTSENRDRVVANGLVDVISIATKCIANNTVSQARVGTGILEHMFKHSEETCKEVISMGGLNSILYECRSADFTTLRHCASALANLSLYGGSDSQESMIKLKAPVWLFPLAFNHDDNIKYYACLAIAVLVANKELEATVLRSGTLNLVEPFVSTHNPQDFAKSSTSHIHGQSKNWLHKLVPVLDSKREEARSLAAFHFAMEAWIKKTQENTSIFREIGAVEALKKVASIPNNIASKYAAQALRLIGEEIPHKLSQQVPLWSIEDVIEWVKQIGFTKIAQKFVDSRVDGDLLLQLTEEMLKHDIGVENGILRKRFLRELGNLKRITDYSSCDSTNLNNILNTLGPEYSSYTYSMLKCGVDQQTLKIIDDEVLKSECKIENSIHRQKILHGIRGTQEYLPEEPEKDESLKTLDVFISYRRSNGSQLASLLKVHLQLRGFSVFIDVERLEAGKFDNNLVNSIRQAKHFILVLSPNALDRCISDEECKDWVHREIVEAINCKCNIIPILDTFQWPETELLPEDMRPVCFFNGVRWIHDYQDACVDKLERFMRGDFTARSEYGGATQRFPQITYPGTPGTPTALRSPAYQRSGSNDSGKSSEHNNNNNNNIINNNNNN